MINSVIDVQIHIFSAVHMLFIIFNTTNLVYQSTPFYCHFNW